MNLSIKNKVHLFIKGCFALFFLLPAMAVAQPGPAPDGAINTRIQREVIDSLASILVDGYYDPSLAKKMVVQIKKYHKAGKYDAIRSGRQFATELTRDLFDVSRDKHILLEYVNAIDKNGSEENLAALNKKQSAFMDAVNHGIDKVERLPGNVGLLELRTFNATIDKTANKIDAALKLLADTHALIIDLRYNSGGSPLAVEYLASYFLDSKPKLINTMVFRTSAGNQPVNVTRKAKGPGLIQQSWTYPVLPEKRYDEKPVYVLISEITASGAESFAYSLQALGRATIVGGVSAGAANPGGTDLLTSNFQIFVPRGKPINPVTNTNWERTGIKPDLASSFENSLKVAYLHALEQIENKGNYAGPEPLKILINNIKEDLKEETNKK